MGDGRQAGKPQVKKAVFESTKKKEIGVSDLTLLSKISNEAINENLKLRFEHDEIYVSCRCHHYHHYYHTPPARLSRRGQSLTDDFHRHTLDMCWCLLTRSATVSGFP